MKISWQTPAALPEYLLQPEGLVHTFGRERERASRKTGKIWSTLTGKRQKKTESVGDLTNLSMSDQPVPDVICPQISEVFCFVVLRETLSFIDHINTEHKQISSNKHTVFWKRYIFGIFAQKVMTSGLFC